MALVVVLMAVQAGVVDAEFPVQKLPQPDPARTAFDDACAMFAASRVAGYRDEKEPEWIAACSRHPDRATCDATRKFMEDALHRPIPELMCGTKGAAPARRTAPDQQIDRASGPPPKAADANAAVHSDVTLSRRLGYVRMAFRFEQKVGVAVTTAENASGNILVLEFTRPIKIEVGQLAAGARDVITAARTDPDGKALRIALGQKVSVHAIPSNTSFVLDLLPENWAGPMPGMTE
jgi:hypothetical protein